ncbi:MAG: site-specific DNA-methyltransferase [Clostridia bacterium]|nr:site-specific DNA-methyltransferase [Clostridia bacterium]
MKTDKSARNKTIETTLEEGGKYLARCFLTPDGSNHSDGIFNGDCLKIAKGLPPGCANLIIADPPYNMYKNFNGSSFSKTDSVRYEEYTRNWIEAVRHTLRDDGSIYVCCDWQCSSIIGSVLGEYFTIRNRITWQREKGRGAKANWKNSMEDIWFATASDNYTFNLEDVKIRRRVIAPYRQDGIPKDWEESSEGNFRDTCPSNFWDDITVPFWSMAENTAHPTQKPEKLMAKLILASSNPGDLVLDPFAGSGTSCVTAKKLGRHFTGIEKDSQYCIWAQQRLEMADEDRTVQGYKDGVFWERNAKKK